MLTIKDKGLTVSLCNQTGNMHLRYSYSIKPNAIGAINALNISNLVIDSYRNKRNQLVTKAVYTTTGDSTHCISAFRAVQKTLMLHTRLHKITQLQEQVKYLQQ